MVQVTVTNKAVYINNTRITSGFTKWGYHTVIDEFECEAAQVRSQLAERGYTMVLDEDYAREFGV